MTPDPNIDFITEGEKRVQAELLSGNWFQGVTVLTNANGDLEASIDTALAELGLFAIVRVYDGKIPEQGTSEPWACEIVVTENALLNRGKGSTGKTARMMVQKIIAARTVAVHLETAREMPSGSHVVWQLKGTVEVAMAGDPATTTTG
jgi:hypothetical protein